MFFVIFAITISSIIYLPLPSMEKSSDSRSSSPQCVTLSHLYKYKFTNTHARTRVHLQPLVQEPGSIHRIIFHQQRTGSEKVIVEKGSGNSLGLGCVPGLSSPGLSAPLGVSDVGRQLSHCPRPLLHCPQCRRSPRAPRPHPPCPGCPTADGPRSPWPRALPT